MCFCVIVVHRDNVDHNLMRKALITELRTFVDMSGFQTVTSIYFGGGELIGHVVIVAIEYFNIHASILHAHRNLICKKI